MDGVRIRRLLDNVYENVANVLPVASVSATVAAKVGALKKLNKF